MLLILLIIYVVVAVGMFVAFAAYYASRGQSVGALPLTSMLWPLFLPLALLFVAFMGVLYVLGGGARRRPIP